MKRVISLVFALFIVICCALPAFTAAQTTEPGYIYFAVPTEGSIAWKNYKIVFCHIWSKTGGDIYPWQGKAERCEDLGNGYWRYDMSALEFKADEEYSLIFSNEQGMQTYNLNVTSACLGDIAVCNGDTIVNPVDGEKQCAVARWSNNGDKVHPAVEIDSNGKTLNVDEIDPEQAETVWGESAGASYEMPELASSEKLETVSSSAKDATEVDPAADNADGLNTNAATTVIIIISAVVIIAVIAVTLVLARRNKK